MSAAERGLRSATWRIRAGLYFLVKLHMPFSICSCSNAASFHVDGSQVLQGRSIRLLQSKLFCHVKLGHEHDLRQKKIKATSGEFWEVKKIKVFV